MTPPNVPSTQSVTTPKTAAARSFVRTLNILLKFVRLYGFEHVRSVAQFETAFSELREAVPEGDDAGMLLGATGEQLFINGNKIEAAPAERTFAQMLSSAGIASIEFLPSITQEELSKLMRAFPTGNAKTSSLAADLKAAVANAKGIRVNKVRSAAPVEVQGGVQDDANSIGEKAAGTPTKAPDVTTAPQDIAQETASADSEEPPAILDDTAAAIPYNPYSSPGATHTTSQAPFTALENSTANSPATTDDDNSASDAPTGFYSGEYINDFGVNLGTGVLLQAQGANQSDDSGMTTSRWTSDAKDTAAIALLQLFTQMAQAAGPDANLASVQKQFQQEVSKLPADSRELIQQAMATLGPQVPRMTSNEPLLLRLAEQLVISHAVNRYENGEVRATVVRGMINHMSQEISALRKVLGAPEEFASQNGATSESLADRLNRQFWGALLAAGKHAAFISPDAWCIPPRTVRQCVIALQEKADLATADVTLQNYASAIASKDATARRRATIGLSEIADLYADGDAAALAPAIGYLGSHLPVEPDTELQNLMAATFVRLSQEAASRSHYAAVLQSLDSLDSIENQSPALAREIRPRVALEKRLPEFVDAAVRNSDPAPAQIKLLARMARPAIDCLTARFNRGASYAEFERIIEISGAIGDEGIACLRERLQTGDPAEAAETTGLLSHLDARAMEKWLGKRIHDWPRVSQDRASRLIAAGGASDRGWLLLSLFDQLDPLLQPLMLDEIGMSGEASAADRLLGLASGEAPAQKAPGSDFLRLKAIEALGRLCVPSAAKLLCEIVETKKLWRWAYHNELRLAAFQALSKISPDWTEKFFPHSDLELEDIRLAPIDGSAGSAWPSTRRFRQRRYPRVPLNTPLTATATSDLGSISLEVRGLSLSGGLASAEKHMAPGTLVTLRLGSGVRYIRAQAFMRDARTRGTTFEFAEMDLDERARLRRLLRTNLNPETPASDDGAAADAPALASKQDS